MKTVKQACQLAENALSIDVSDQIEQIDQLINEEGNGDAFYEKTFITAGMRDLLKGTIARLAGKSSNAVFHLKQSMGGGKTHLIVGTGLAAKHKSVRQKYCADIDYIEAFDNARVVAFNGRNSPDHFIWGEIAHQLGQGEAFKKFWVGGPSAPDEKDWTDLLKSEVPTLILLDELPPYFQYLGTRVTGTGTVADIAARAFANMLSAAGKLSNVCIVVSDLDASYAQGGALIARALQDARHELGRQETNITPVDLSGNEIYDILRKRLFTKMPDIAEIEDLAARYGQALEEAAQSKVLARGAEAIASEIVQTYPFHPRLKGMVALFKENESFKQTRGLMELMSRLLKSVWERETDDVYLIGAQHFDFSKSSVRNKLVEISGMSELISKDVWDAEYGAHAQVIDANLGNKNASEVAGLLVIASLSTAFNAVKGLTSEEVLECVVSPFKQALEYKGAIEGLQAECWFLHKTVAPKVKLYFDKQENMSKMLQGLAASAPDGQIDDLVKTHLKKLFAPTRKSVYSHVMPLPTVTEITESVKRGRVLLVIDPHSKLPPDQMKALFNDIQEKNNFLVLTGDKTRMADVNASARKKYAVSKAASKISVNHVQYEEFLQRKESAEQDFDSTLLGVFDKLIFPVQIGNNAPDLKVKALNTAHDKKNPFDGELQIEKVLSDIPKKLFLHLTDVSEFDSIRDAAESILWNEGSPIVDWATVVAREKQKAKMPWLPPGGLDQLKSIAIQKGLWEDLGTGHISREPAKKKTAVQVVADSRPDEDGFTVLRVNALNAGPSGRVHYCEDGVVCVTSPVLKSDTLRTNAYKVQFLAIDPNGSFETGVATNWSNRISIKAAFDDKTRTLELFATPKAAIKYTLDGMEPRHGVDYEGPITIGESAVKVLVFAEGGGLEAKERFEYAAAPKAGAAVTAPVQFIMDRSRPVKLTKLVNVGSRSEVFAVIDLLKSRNTKSGKLSVTLGNDPQVVQFTLGDVSVDGAALETVINQISTLLSVNAPISMRVEQLDFQSGQDLLDLSELINLELAGKDFTQ